LNRASEVTVINVEERREEEVAEKRGEDFKTESKEGKEKGRERRGRRVFIWKRGRGLGGWAGLFDGGGFFVSGYFRFCGAWLARAD